MLEEILSSEVDIEVQEMVQLAMGYLTST